MAHPAVGPGDPIAYLAPRALIFDFISQPRQQALGHVKQDQQNDDRKHQHSKLRPEPEEFQQREEDKNRSDRAPDGNHAAKNGPDDHLKRHGYFQRGGTGNPHEMSIKPAGNTGKKSAQAECP